MFVASKSVGSDGHSFHMEDTMKKRKQMVMCRAIEFIKHGTGMYFATCIRTTSHPSLGQPTGKMTRTSQVLRIDFELKRFETENTIYMWL